MADSAPPPSDRRIGERYLACFPASVQRPDGEQRPSIIRDLSESGALLLVRTTKIAVGDPIKLQLYIADDTSTFREAQAKVVRVEELVPGDAGPWLRRVAVQFDAPISMYAADIAAFHDRALRLGLK
jgi:PilZ domain